MKLTEKKRLQILDTAEKMFYEVGVEHTTMDQLAAQAGVSKRTVYNHFENKDALFAAIIERMLSSLSSADPVLYHSNQPLEAQLTKIAENEVQLLTSPEFLRVAKIGFMQLLKDSDLAKHLTQIKIGCLGYLADFLTAACDDGRLVIEDCDFASKQFVYQLKSFVFYPLLYGFETVTSAQKKQVIEETVQLVLSRYKPTE